MFQLQNFKNSHRRIPRILDTRLGIRFNYIFKARGSAVAEVMKRNSRDICI